MLRAPRPEGGSAYRRRRRALSCSPGDHLRHATQHGRGDGPAGRRPWPRGPADPPRACCPPGRPATARGRTGRPAVRRGATTPAGSAEPWRHQAAAADAAHAGQHVVLATGTASGKSLAYQLPALTAIRGGSRAARPARRHRPLPRADQGAGPGPARRARRARPRRPGHHPRRRQHPRPARLGARPRASTSSPTRTCCTARCCPATSAGRSFLGPLRYVVIDECHHYRGVFGAHVAHVLRRLRRICAPYGARPTFVLASATVAEPEAAAGRLTGLDVLAVTGDGSPRGEVSLALWEPPLTSYTGENGAPVRRAASSETADLLADLVAEGVRTLAFVRSRRGAEQVAMTAAELLAEVDPSLPARVAAYRGGYLPEERRELEQPLRAGELLGLAATNALELGIDISGLDAVLMAGFPGTRAALWQQVGRAGRGAQDALGVLVARDDPLDTYLVNHPEALLGRPVEATVFDPTNPYVLGPHLCAAAARAAPDRGRPAAVRARPPATWSTQLTDAGLLRRRPRGWFWTDRRRASDLADIRSTGGAAGASSSRRTPAGWSAPSTPASAHGTAHAGAVYVHRGETWLVESLDLDEHVAVIGRADPDLLHLGARDHRHLDRRGARAPQLGRLPAVVGRGRRHPPGRVLPEAPPARRRGDRRGAARPARAHAAHHRRSGGPCPTTPSRGRRAGHGRPARRRARRRALLDRPAAAVRDLRPLGHRRRLHRRAPRHRPAHRLRLRRPPRRRRLRRARLRVRRARG